MNKLWSTAGRGILILALATQSGVEAWEMPPDDNEPMVVRLVHPDRQATEFLRLFEGARAASPAAALATWKRATGHTGQLGKPIEAVIALFNPDMVPEWRVLDGAELRLGFEPDDGSPRWFAIVPRDDGTVAAAITASRLTYPDDEPLREEGRETPVARLGSTGVPLAVQVGSRLIFGSSRPELLRGIRSRPTASDAASLLDSGLVFRLDTKALTTPRGGSLGLRRTVEALQGIDCRLVEGTIALKAGYLGFDITTILESPKTTLGKEARVPTIEVAWLEHFPVANLMAMVSIAIDSRPAFWDRAFSLADRIERADPARAGVAPLRTRLNLLALAAGIKLEADLWPHLQGVSAGIWVDPRQPGKPIAALLALHLNEEATAQRLARARTGALLQSRTTAKQAPQHGADAGPPPGEPRREGALLGRNVSVWQQHRDVLIAWGDDALTALMKANIPAAQSVATIHLATHTQGRGAPRRFGAFWPGRLYSPGKGSDLSPATLRVLADDPPVVWCGWDDRDRAFDQFRWPDLAGRVRRYLETIPLAP